MSSRSTLEKLILECGRAEFMGKDSEFDFNLFRAIEVFVAIVEARQVTLAAQMLGMTQSAASQYLKALESGLGVQLIDRRTRPIELTRAGISLHRRAISILNEVESLRAEARHAMSGALPALRIGILASVATILAPVLANLVRRRLKVDELTLSAGLANDHLVRLRTRRADIAVTSEIVFEAEDLSRHPILTESFLLVTPKGYSGPLDDLEKLARELPFVRFSRDTPVGLRVEQHLSRTRVALPRSLDGDRASVVMAPVAAGNGFSILTPTLLLDGLAEGMELDVRELPIPGFSRRIILVSRERELGDLPEQLAQASAACLAEAIAKRLPDLPGRFYSPGN